MSHHRTGAVKHCASSAHKIRMNLDSFSPRCLARERSGRRRASGLGRATAGRCPLHLQGAPGQQTLGERSLSGRRGRGGCRRRSGELARLGWLRQPGGARPTRVRARAQARARRAAAPLRTVFSSPQIAPQNYSHGPFYAAARTLHLLVIALCYRFPLAAAWHSLLGPRAHTRGGTLDSARKAASWACSHALLCKAVGRDGGREHPRQAVQ